MWVRIPPGAQMTEEGDTMRPVWPDYGWDRRRQPHYHEMDNSGPEPPHHHAVRGQWVWSGDRPGVACSLPHHQCLTSRTASGRM